MSQPTTENYVLPSWLRLWEQFWFTPADPSILGLMRAACGLITVYTLVVYSFSLQDFMGKDAWHDMQLRNQIRYERPISPGTYAWKGAKVGPPMSDWQKRYFEAYREKFKVDPPLPYPDEDDHATVDLLDEFMRTFQIDLRVNGLKPPKSQWEHNFAWSYTRRWKGPPPAYPKDEEDLRFVDEYMEEFGADPRRLYDKGTPIWSIWLHVTDPQQMAIVHGLFIFAAVCFTLGFCTRITTAVTWFSSLCYIHRNPQVLFGVDTMMIIVLLYLMISPCGQVFSVDAVIRRWWARAKPGVIAAWSRFWKQPIPESIAPATPAEVQPSVSANVVIRLLQIHVCIIYLVAGLSKLQGQAWWNGGALWMTLGNYEFAPMQFELYLKFLRFIGSEQWMYDGFMTAGGIFTLCFEIGYAFLIWRPKLRWTMLGSAILLHGFIGLFMGLKTFSLMMLVMNMAFLKKEETLWILSWFNWFGSGAATPTVAAPVTPAPPSKHAITAAK